MKNRKRWLLYVWAVVSVLLVVLCLGSPAEAHTSHYCGHSDKGWYNVEYYISHYSSSGRHYHRYAHTTLWGWRHLHYLTTYCPVYY